MNGGDVENTGATGVQARRRLLSATAVMASGTMVSRVFGFIRTMLVAFALGNTTIQGDAFMLATVVPNSLYMIFAGGALNTVLVPQIVRHIKSDADAGVAFINRVMTAFLLALLAVTVAAVAFTPQVMGLWMGEAWSSQRLAPHRDSLFFLACLTMPQVFFYGAFFLIGQVLNAREKFGPMMWAPIVNNVVQIGVLGAYALTWASASDHSAPFTTPQVLLLGIGSTVGIVAQTLALVPAMRAVGLRFRPRFDLRGQGLGATFHLAKWAIGYVLLTQAAAVVVTRLASSATVVDPAKPGPGVLAYNEAYLTWILPHSLLTVSLATALLPAASRLAAAGDLGGVADEITRSVRMADTFIVPAAVGLGVLGFPFASLVFGNGAGASDWHAVGLTIVCFAVGLVPYTLQYLYLRGYYALEDMRSAFALQIAISGLNAALALGWVSIDPDPLTVAPRLALCYSASYLLGAVLTFRALSRRLPGLRFASVFAHCARALLAALPGAAAAWWIVSSAGSQRLVQLAGFVATCLVFGVAYVALARLLRVSEVTEIVGALLRRLGRSPRPPAADAVPDAEPIAPALPGGGRAPGTDTADDPVAAGELLDGRYRLNRPLERHAGATTWLATDEALARPVEIHVLPLSAPRTLEVLDEARQAAPRTDARFLRVLDAVLAEGRPYGSYIVCEHADGSTLTDVLRESPLTAQQACWIVREVAEGVAAMHAQGHAHRHLSPDTVIVTASGTVKIVGFPLAAALDGPAPREADGEDGDVVAIGRLLYATLADRWPGPASYGLAAAPTDSRGRPLPPRLISPGVPARASTVVEETLGPDGSAWGRLVTASDIEGALTDVLADPSLRASPPDVAEGDIADDPAVRDGDRNDGGADADATASYLLDPFGDEPTGRIAHALTPSEAEGVPYTPVPPPAEPDIPGGPLPAPSAHRGMALLALLFVAVLVAGLVGVFIRTYNETRNPTGPRLVTLATVQVFDPQADGGDGSENSAQASLAIDGQASTAWRTERYGKSADFNGRKPGVGLLLDLGSVQTVGVVRVDLAAGPTDLDLRVPNAVNPAAAPTASVKEWRTVVASPSANGQTTISLPSPVQTRYLLLYLTRLPPAAGAPGFQGAIAEIEVTS